MSEAGVPKTSALRCDLMPREEFASLQKVKDQKLKWCRLSQQEDKKGDVFDGAVDTENLDEAIKDAAGSFDVKECHEGNVAAELSQIIKMVRNNRSVESMCNTFAPFNKRIHDKNRNTPCPDSSGQTASQDPTTCEIAGPDGRCPGAPEPVRAPIPTRKSQTKSFIHFGEQAATSR